MSWPGYLAVIVGSALVSAVCVALSIRVANRLAFHDHPDGGRKTQDRPIPKLGGVAVAAAFTLSGLAATMVVNGSAEIVLGTAGVLIPALGAALLGYADDRQHLDPKLRIGLQAALAVVAFLAGSQVRVTGIPLLDAIATMVFYLVVVNGINLLDNSDGLAGSTVLVSAVGASVIAAIFGQQLVGLLGVALVGVCLGFLWHNWHPATVYLGDAGAYFLGFLLATLVIRLRPDSVPPVAGSIIALLLVALPLVDTTYVVVKRLRAGIHPFTAGRDHLSHVIQDRGRSVPFSVLSLQAVLVITTGIAVLLSLVLA